MQAAVGEQAFDQRREQDVVGLIDPRGRGRGDARAKIGQANLPGRRNFIDDHHDGRPLSCAWFQAWNNSSSSCLSAPSNNRPPTRSTNPRASNERPDRRGPVSKVALDRPHAPVAEMLERVAVGVGNDEAARIVSLRPIERQRDLVRAAGHGDGAGGGAGAGGGPMTRGMRKLPPTPRSPSRARPADRAGPNWLPR